MSVPCFQYISIQTESFSRSSFLHFNNDAFPSCFCYFPKLILTDKLSPDMTCLLLCSVTFPNFWRPVFRTLSPNFRCSRLGRLCGVSTSETFFFQHSVGKYYFNRPEPVAAQRVAWHTIAPTMSADEHHERWNKIMTFYDNGDRQENNMETIGVVGFKIKISSNRRYNCPRLNVWRGPISLAPVCAVVGRVVRRRTFSVSAVEVPQALVHGWLMVGN